MGNIDPALMPEIQRLWKLYASSGSRLSFDTWLQREPIHQFATIKPMVWAVHLACKEFHHGH